jgi:hypothetical protein
MKTSGNTITPFSANPFMFIFSVVAIVGMVLYLGYVAFDRLGLQVEEADAIVLDKQHYAGGEAPLVNIVAGRPWVQSQLTPEIFLLTLKSEAAHLQAAVTKPVFDAMTPGDTVSIKYQRQRISGGIQVIAVSK